MLLRKHFLNIKMSEKLCLQWNDFQENIKIAFGNLREDKDFKDVTLVSEDGQQVEVHKVISAASSPFFQNLFVRSKHPHPLIYMRGMDIDDLLAIVDFIYFGEANVSQERLDTFLAIAKELQLNGLLGKADGRSEDLSAGKKCNQSPKLEPTSQADSELPKPSYKREISNYENFGVEDSFTVAVPREFSADFDHIKEMVESMMEKSENLIATGRQKAHKCNVCGKEGLGSHIKDHIEAKHIEGISIPCNICGRIVRSTNALRQHKKMNHKAETNLAP